MRHWLSIFAVLAAVAALALIVGKNMPQNDPKRIRDRPDAVRPGEASP